MMKVYDEFDHLIDVCENANLKAEAEKLRNMRDNLPEDQEEEMVMV